MLSATCLRRCSAIRALLDSDHHRVRTHLEAFATELNATHPVRECEPNGRGIKYSYANIVITSPQLCAGLATHGIAPRKTLTHQWPDSVPDGLLNHYLRGYFDGDGWLQALPGTRIRKRDGQRPIRILWGIIGTEAHCLGAQSYLVAKLGLNRTKLAKTVNPRILKLCYGGNRQVQRIAKLLYRNATVYLPRKREKVAHLP